MIKKTNIKNAEVATKEVLKEKAVAAEANLEKATTDNVEPKEEKSSIGGFDFNKFKVSKSKGTRKAGGKGFGALSVVNNRNGMRVTIAAEVYDKIGSPEKLQFAFSDNEVAVFSSLPDNLNYFQPRGKGTGKKALIYSAPLVREITEKYGLDFKGISMKTFYDVRYEINEDVTIAIIKIRD